MWNHPRGHVWNVFVSIYPSYKGAEVVGEINIDISELIINYIQKHKKIDVLDECNYIVKY